MCYGDLEGSPCPRAQRGHPLPAPTMCLTPSTSPLAQPSVQAMLQDWHSHDPHSTGGETGSARPAICPEPQSPTTRQDSTQPASSRARGLPNYLIEAPPPFPTQGGSWAALRNVSGPGRGFGWEKGVTHQQPTPPMEGASGAIKSRTVSLSHKVHPAAPC